jgi:hypothetical protein
MAKAERSPKISDGALVLLRIAREDDRHRAIARNAALLAVLECSKEIVEACKSGTTDDLFALTKAVVPPWSFLTLTAGILQSIYNQIPIVSDFNGHVLAGFAQALADIAWPMRAATDFDGPSIEEFQLRIGQQDVETLWRGTLQNYLANILQDYFASLRIRESVPDLEPTAEVDLRILDAHALADFAIQLAPRLGHPTEPAIIAFALNQTIDEVLEDANQE